ncbi:hypothetical protein FB45DRAFT_121251 [Roridomyces roridus]|uniref:BTB domain-containing protein n=1 Tax=Roridomyces roridus TaxID=1738132 RepID=A0AAD7BI35_9AGAR|nr:hypothetical protein FB45DRAFT_121251 [Roridomyces roridus]
MAAPQRAVDLKPRAQGQDKASSSSSKRFHPAFAALDADIVLESSDGELYRIHAYTLRSTSGFFRAMLSLPQPPGRRDATIQVHQPKDTVEQLLCLMCGLDMRPWHSYDDLAAVLALAEIWDTPGPIASLRAVVTNPKYLTTAPLDIYVLAVHFGWTVEAELASTHTLTLNLSSPEHADTLASLPAPALLALLNLHRKRRDTLRTLLDSPARFLAGNGNPFHCGTCAITPLDNTSWRALKHRVFREMDERPIGDGLGVPVGGICEWEEARACWAAKCLKPGCGAVNYDRVATLKQIKACVDGLPRVIQWDWD